MNYEDVKMFCIAGLPNGKSSSVIPSGLCIGGFNFSETLISDISRTGRREFIASDGPNDKAPM